MKQKVAIVTINHSFNYGNKLQNYAVQRIYEEMGLDAETIRFYPEGLKVKFDGKKKSFSHYTKRIKVRMNEQIFAGKIQKRKDSFEHFDNNMLKMTLRIYTPRTYNEIRESDYDFFSVGSDQVWNTYFYDFTPMYFLDFVSDGSKKIAFSASFGVDDISPQYYDKAICALRQFKSISVREQKGVDILNTIVGVPATLVLDPTLYLPVEEWEKAISSVNKKVPSKYVVLYFLGDLDRNTERKICQKAKESGCKIIRLNDMKSEYYFCDPFEFVYLIQNAEYVYTDSFHATCFSLQFHKKFVVMPRVSRGKSMESRLDSLLSLLGLSSRIDTNGGHIDDKIDYCNVDNILKKERMKSRDFLRNAFSMGG